MNEKALLHDEPASRLMSPCVTVDVWKSVVYAYYFIAVAVSILNRKKLRVKSDGLRVKSDGHSSEQSNSKL